MQNNNNRFRVETWEGTPFGTFPTFEQGVRQCERQNERFNNTFTFVVVDRTEQTRVFQTR